MRTGKIIIRLNSDLCASSGYSYAGVIDTDLAYDSYGIPYIPGRRLKGCLKETCDSLLYGIISDEMKGRLFGVTGDSKTRGIFISNAKVIGYEDLANELDGYKSVNLGAKITRTEVLEAFTDVIAQTSIDSTTGSAKDNSLRFTRVVKKYSDILGQNMAFECSVKYPEELENELKLIVKGTKNIGYKRNRGLGLVSCELVPEVLDDTIVEETTCDEFNKIEIEFRNTTPLMLTGSMNDETMKYIPGKVIKGYLANKYLESYGYDDGFEELFLSDITIFTNAYLANQNGMFYPAPLYVNMLKKTKKMVNITLLNREEEKAPPYNTDNGNLPKKFKKFINFSSHEYADVTTEIIYHHSHKAGEKNNEDVLYNMQAISENQCFKTIIKVHSKYATKLLKLIGNSLNLGKSKTAQYGYCEVTKSSLSSYQDEKREFKKDSVLVVSMLSDSIFQNEIGYTYNLVEVKDIIANELGIVSYDKSYDRSYIETTSIGGYSGAWNMKTDVIPAVKMGSYVTFKLFEDCTISKDYVGEKNSDGFGLIRLDSIGNGLFTDYKLDFHPMVEATKETAPGKLIKEILAKRIKDALCLKASTAKCKLSTGSENGRVLMMLDEATMFGVGDKEFADFNRRINSIKTDKTRDAALGILQLIGKENKEKSEEISRGTEKRIGKKQTVYILDCEKMLELLGDNPDLAAYRSIETKYQTILSAYWKDYIKTLLIYKKYELAQRGE